MIASRCISICSIFLIVCAGSGGCTRQANRPATAPVSGEVTFRGKPVVGATVTFIATNSPRYCSGTTDKNGRFVLSTFEPGDGAVIGENIVTIFKPAKEIPTTAIDASLDAEAYVAELEKAAQRAMVAQQAGSALPERYASPQTSDLRRQVGKGENVIKIDLSE